MTDWFYVLKFDPKEKEDEVLDWLRKKGISHWSSLDGVVSVKAYMRSMGLGSSPLFQIWIQVRDLSVLNVWKDQARQILFIEELFPLITRFESAIVKNV